MNKLGFTAVALIVAASVGAKEVLAQQYPTKPIRIVTSSSGSSTDTTSRLVAAGLSAALGQPVIVDNQGAGFIQGDMVAKAPPDGHVVVIAANGLWISPLLQKAPYDAVKDFAAISLIASTPNILFVNPGVPANNARELIALAKAKPGELNYASGSTGGTSHLAGELLNFLAATKIVRISYKGGSQQTLDLLSGQVQMQFNTLDGYQGHLKSGRLRAIAVGSTKPSTLLPDVLPLSATLPGFEAVVNLGMFAPAKTPPSIVMRLNQEVVRVINSKESQTRLENIAVEPVASSPEALASAVQADINRYGKLIRELGIAAR